MSVTFYLYDSLRDVPLDDEAHEAAGLPVNVSNANAGTILAALGLDPVELCGCLPGVDFLGRVLVAVAVEPYDEGVAPAAYQGGILGFDLGVAGTFVDCGRRPGYLQDKLTVLGRLADYAADRALDVAWC
jgi:hypothetical protein